MPPLRSHSYSVAESGIVPLHLVLPVRHTQSQVWKRRFWTHSRRCWGNSKRVCHDDSSLILQMKKVRQTSLPRMCRAPAGARSPPAPPPATPLKLRKPNPHTAGSFSFPAKFILTLQDKKHKRVPMGQAVTAVPFNRVYDFPGASRPGDARE